MQIEARRKDLLAAKQTWWKLFTSRCMYSIPERIRQNRNENSVMGRRVTKINGILLSKDFALCHLVVSRFGNSQFRPESIRHSLPDAYVSIVCFTTRHLALRF